MRKWLFQVVCALLVGAYLLAGPPCPASAAVTSGDRFAVARAEQPFALDPTLADPRWEGAFTARDFIDLATKLPARSRTRGAVFYDNSNLYVAFRVDQAAPVTATQTTNNIGFGLDDFVGVGIDPIGNGERAYYFETTPRGVRYQQANESARYLPEWRAAGATNTDGWSAMMIIPLRVLKIPSDGPQRWRFNFTRYLAASGERDTWSYDQLMGNYPINNFPDFRETRWWPTASGMVLTGAVPKPAPRAEIYALSSSGGDHNVFTTPSGQAFVQNARHAGIDAAYALRPTVNLDLALSPDFSNVEIDQQSIAPTQFRRNFREYRPFFAKGANYINTQPENYQLNFAPDAVFYSPSIGPFDRGVKLEGTQGTQSFGMLETAGNDPTTGNRFDDIAFGFKHKRPNNTFAYWADGVLAHHSNGHDGTVEAGFYGRSLASGLVYSYDHASETGSFVKNPGLAQKNEMFIDLQKSGFEANLGWQDIGPQYNPIDGFTNIADIRGPLMSVDYVYTPKSSRWMKNTEIFLFGDRWLDRQGNVHETDADAYLNIRTKKQFTLNLISQVGSQRSYDGNGFSSYPSGYVNMVTNKYVAPQVGFVVGDGAPNSFAANYQWGTFGSFYLNQISSTTTYQFGTRMALAFDYAGTRERPFAAGAANGQWLRRLSLALPLGQDGNASLSYRVISGRGGFATPGKNLALALRKKFAGGNELFVNYGTPAAGSTLDRLIVKYLVRVGGGV